MGQLTHYSQVRHLPPGVSPMPAPARSIRSPFRGSGVWRVLSATDAGKVTKGQRGPDDEALGVGWVGGWVGGWVKYLTPSPPM